MNEHKHFAISTKKRCKHCGKFHGYITAKHRIVIADEDFKFLLQEFAIKYPGSEIIELDLKLPNPKFIHIEFVLGQHSPHGYR